MRIFFLSGLGADKTVFQFLDLPSNEAVYIDWISPYKNESLRDYALRLKQAFIPDDAIIVGLSFGGMLATEIAKEFPSIKAILISTSKTKFEVPFYYQAGKIFRVHNWCPATLQRWFMLRIKWLFGISSERSKKIYETLIRNSDTKFNSWAIDAIIHWDNEQIPQNIFHIHGTHDRVLPYKYVRSNETIKKGGHLMVMEQAEIVSKLLRNLIAEHEARQQALSSSANRIVDRFPT